MRLMRLFRGNKSSTPLYKRPLLLYFVFALAVAVAAWQIRGSIISLSSFSQQHDKDNQNEEDLLLPHQVRTSSEKNDTKMEHRTSSNTKQPTQDPKRDVTSTRSDSQVEQYNNNNKNKNDDDNEDEIQYYDLIFWFKTPTIPEGWNSSDMIVTRAPTTKSDSALLGTEEVIRVDFRFCNETCPRTAANDANAANDTLLQYKKNKRRTLNFYLTPSSKQKNLKKMASDVMELEAITFWSDDLHRHIPIHLYQAKDFQWNICTRDRRKPCPQPCHQNHYHLEYPYLYDRIDKLCKSSHPDAIPPTRLYGGKCSCETTCFTPEAVELNSTWPWKDAAQRDRYAPYWNNSDKRKELNSFYKQSKSQRLTMKAYQSYQPRFPCTSENISTPQPIFGDYQHHLYFIPEAKLIFCGIPKAGITEWVKFFRYVLGANDYLSLPHYKEDRIPFFMTSLEASLADELLNDPTWTKAVFIRDPLERLLSAYMDKIVGQAYTQKVFRIGNITTPKKERVVMNFTEFVEKIADKTKIDDCKDPTGLKACTDPHWKPQLMTCGLDYLLPKFDFVGNFAHISKHTKLLLERVGLWDQFGAMFDDGKGIPPENGWICYVPPPKRSSNETVLGFNQRGPSGTGKTRHATGSKSYLADYYTPELIKKVREAYALDFAVWDEIQSKPEDEVARGKELKVVQDYCASKVGTVSFR